MKVAFPLVLGLLAACNSERTPDTMPTTEAAAAAEPDKCADSSGEFGEAGYRACWHDEATKSRERVMTALARNRREAAQEDAEWEEYRRTNRFGRDLDPTHLEALNISQKAWEEYVNAQCILEGYTALGGTAEPGYESMCRDRLNLERLKELRSPFIIEAKRDEPVPEE